MKLTISFFRHNKSLPPLNQLLEEILLQFFIGAFRKLIIPLTLLILFFLLSLLFRCKRIRVLPSCKSNGFAVRFGKLETYWSMEIS